MKEHAQGGKRKLKGKYGQKDSHVTSSQATTVGAFHSANGVPAANASANRCDLFLYFLSNSRCPVLPCVGSLFSDSESETTW